MIWMISAVPLYEYLCVCVFLFLLSRFHDEDDNDDNDLKQIILCILQCECFFVHTKKHAPLFADRILYPPIKILRNYLNRPNKIPFTHNFRFNCVIYVTLWVQCPITTFFMLFLHIDLWILSDFWMNWLTKHWTAIKIEHIDTHKITCVIQTATIELLVDNKQPFYIIRNY